MKRTAKKYSVLALLPVLLAGCGGVKMKGSDLMLVEQAKADSKARCMQAVAAGKTAQMNAISMLPPETAGYVLMAGAMVDQAQALSGKHPCDDGDIGMYNYLARVSEAQNKALADITGNAITGTLGVVGILETGKTIRAGFNAAKGTYQVNANGEGSSATYSPSTTKYDSNTKSTVVGDGSAEVQGGLTHDQGDNRTYPQPEAPVESAPEAPVEAAP